MSLIHIDLGFVDDLRQRADQTAVKLREDERDLGGTPSSPIVNGALHQWRRDWDERRGELAGTLQSVVDALTAIHDSFEGTDLQLKSELEGNDP